jgi:ABC-2 type transport system permease protein
VFFSVGLLPGFWEQVALVNPILYMVNALRYGMLGITDVSLGLAYSMILIFGAILLYFSLFLLRRGVGLRT